MSTVLSVNELCEKIGNKTKVIAKSTSCGTAVFSEAGARLIGLFPSTESANTLWVAENIDSRISSGDWQTGGERLWIAPQRDFFFTNPQKFEGFHVSSDLDPGSYSQKDDLTFENIFTLRNHHKKVTYSECIARRKFAMINDDPYQSGLDYVGVQIDDYLSISSSEINMCAWSITMVATCGPEKPGTVLLPMANLNAVVNYFDPIPYNRFSTGIGFSRFLIDSKKALKLAIRPEGVVWDNPAKIMYISPFSGTDKWFCLIKRTEDLPKNQENCVDPTVYNPHGPKGAIQAYNHGYDSEMLYGEIELQLNKGLPESNRVTSCGTHELLSYSGTKKEILNLAKIVLRADEVPEVY